MNKETKLNEEVVFLIWMLKISGLKIFASSKLNKITNTNKRVEYNKQTQAAKG